MFADLPRPTIFAHRGSSAHAPENTLAAFELALRQDADALELDAKLTADGEVVVIHDPTVNRTTGSTGVVHKMTLEQLRELDAGSFFDIAFKGERIPTLKEVFEAVGNKTFINVELTNYDAPWDSLADKVAGLVKKYGLRKHVMFSSFMPFALWRVHTLLPEIPIGLLCWAGRAGALSRSWPGNLVPHQSLNPALDDVTHSLVKHQHRKGQRVYVYTLTDAEDMRRMFSWGVDGIFADDPLLARRVLKTVNSGQ